MQRSHILIIKGVQIAPSTAVRPIVPRPPVFPRLVTLWRRKRDVASPDRQSSRVWSHSGEENGTECLFCGVPHSAGCHPSGQARRRGAGEAAGCHPSGQARRAAGCHPSGQAGPECPDAGCHPSGQARRRGATQVVRRVRSALMRGATQVVRRGGWRGATQVVRLLSAPDAGGHPGGQAGPAGYLAQRIPRLAPRPSIMKLTRSAARSSLAVLCQLPPRLTWVVLAQFLVQALPLVGAPW